MFIGEPSNTIFW